MRARTKTDLAWLLMMAVVFGCMGLVAGYHAGYDEGEKEGVRLYERETVLVLGPQDMPDCQFPVPLSQWEFSQRMYVWYYATKCYDEKKAEENAQ